ncbi:MAG: NAD+ synthase [Terriglobia bacterium]
MKVGLAQINPTVGDFEGNGAKIRNFARQAKARGAELVVFPELCLCGYPPHDLVELPRFLRRNREEVERLARELLLPAIVGFVGQANAASGKQATNRAALLAGGRIEFEQDKMLLPTYDVFDEARHFAPAARQRVVVFCGSRVALTICEDSWNDKDFWQYFSERRLYACDPVEELMGQGSDLLINISASPYYQGKRGRHLEMLEGQARRYRVAVVMVNQVGGNDSLIFDGASVGITAEGRVGAQAASFAEDLVLFDTASGQGEVRPQPADELEELWQALTLGIRDYVRKCRFGKVVVGLSGGIDSSLVATLAVAALGADNVLGVSMPGPYSSPGSLADAQKLARNLGIRLLVIPITEVFEQHKKALAEAFRGAGSFGAEDVTEENLQARIRGNTLMALSNKFGALVLSTGNKSELAVGYCTLYGDLAGGLAAISDVPKMVVYKLAGWANREREVIPADCFKKPPSAELRPNQTDQDSLPAYQVLDKILQGYIEELRTPAEIAKHYGVALAVVKSVVERIHRSEYKRYQAPPGLKVTRKAFGLGRRFPIAKKDSRRQP